MFPNGNFTVDRLCLQYLKEHREVAEHALYVSLDDIWMDAFELYDLVKYHVQNGGTSVFIDEVHYLKDWPRLLDERLKHPRKKLESVRFGAADRCGFASPEDMRRVFKKVEGRTIGKYIGS